MDELFDAYDENMIPIGVASRQTVHRCGIWHQTFQCWVLHRSSEGNFLVLQRRHRSKDTHPNKLDISCAGHLAVGEMPSDGVRELREELGLEVDFNELRPIGLYKYAHSGDGVEDNEFCHMFLLERAGKERTDYHPAVGEVSGLYFIFVDDMKRLCRRQVNEVQIGGFEVLDDGQLLEQTTSITLGDMVKYDLSYYELLFSCLEP